MENRVAAADGCFAAAKRFPRHANARFKRSLVKLNAGGRTAALACDDELARWQG